MARNNEKQAVRIHLGCREDHLLTIANLERATTSARKASCVMRDSRRGCHATTCGRVLLQLGQFATTLGAHPRSDYRIRNLHASNTHHLNCGLPNCSVHNHCAKHWTSMLESATSPESMPLNLSHRLAGGANAMASSTWPSRGRCASSPSRQRPRGPRCQDKLPCTSGPQLRTLPGPTSSNAHDPHINHTTWRSQSDVRTS